MTAWTAMRLLAVAMMSAAAPAMAAEPEVNHSKMDHSRMDHAQMDHSKMGHSQTDHPKMDHSQMDHSKMGHSQVDHSQTDHAQMDHSKMGHSQVDHSQMDHSQTGHSTIDHASMDHSTMDHSTMDHSTMDHGAHDPAGPTLPPITDADRRAAFPVLAAPHPTHGDAIHHYLLFDRLEASESEHGSTPLAWEVEGWLGTDTDRLWLRSEGERSGGRTHAVDVELLYGRSVSAWWDVVAGVRHEFLPHDARSWAAIGLQGLAPGMFEVQATAYVGEGGRTRASVELEYEVLLTNRWILQPVVEATWHGQSDATRGIGSGLSTAEAGLRLRYEVTRRFAPYVGVVRERAFGDTADLRRADGEAVDDTRMVAGLRFWF